jgi:RNA polymerase sigma factor (sigma-70 family)
MLADAILLERYAVARDPDAFAEIVHRHTGLVFGVCRRLCGNAADAEDVAQDCFLQLARHAGRIRSSLPAWLHTVAMHAAVRANRRRRALHQESIDANLVATAAADAGAWQELIPQVDAALSELPIEQREALVLRYLEDRSQEDIADLLGISQPTVSRRLTEGVVALRRRLGPHAGLALPMLAVLPPPSLVATVGRMGLAGVGAPVAGAAAKGWSASPIGGALSLATGAVAIAIAGLLAWPRTTYQASSSVPVPASAPAPMPLAAPAWLGMNHGVMDQATLIADLKACGLRIVRDGFNGKPDDAFSAKVDAYLAAGIEPHISINMRGGGIDVAAYQPWLANYRRRCVEIMTAYKGKLGYYIVGNEPDKDDAFTGRLTPEQAVDFTRMAYQASREADPTGAIRVESSPLSSPSPGKNYLQRMLAAGLSDCCDFIGIHVYSNQIDDGVLDRPWRFQQEHGGTQKPIAISEAGMSGDWRPKGFSPEETQRWKADFIAQAYVQFKRYGVANVILFESGSPSPWPNTFALMRDATPERNILKPTYSELAEHFRPVSLQNGGFELPNDFKHDWVISDDPVDGRWSTDGYDFKATGGHGGQAALRMDMSVKGMKIVRQVVSGLPVGRPVTIMAWAFSGNQAGATLKAQGYDAIAGNAEVSATTNHAEIWEPLTVTVAPTNPWVVIELSAVSRKDAPGSSVRFDDVSVSVSGK